MPDQSWIAARARDLRREPTDAERRLWRSLRLRRFTGHKFRRQVPLGNYIVDFVCLDARLVIEVDGAHHLDQRAHDAARDTWLRAQGFRVLRFWDSQVLTAPDEVDEAILQALEGKGTHEDPAPPTPTLPREGGGAGGSGMTTAPDPIVLGALAQAVAREAGALLMERLPGTREVDTKTSPVDVVTEVDRASEALIVARILEARPDDGFLGEEGADTPARTGVRWIIDPIDGTVNYLYRRTAFAVCIAAEVDGRVAAGVVYNPFLDELFAATLGQGATLNGVSIHVSTESRLPHALCGTGFDYRAEGRRVQATVLSRVIHEVRDIRREGSAALDLCAVACGRLDVYYERGVHLWDVAAAGLILREAGGRAEPLTGEPFKDGDTWLGTNAALYVDFRALIGSASGLDAPSKC